MVSESVSCPVSMMIGALKPPLRRERTTSRPSVSGNPTSISTRSGASALAAVAPLAPVSTAEASNSSCSDNCSTSVSRRSLSSSTIRILRALAMGPILWGRRREFKRLGPGLGWSRSGLSELIRLEVRGCYGFTTQDAVYSRFRTHLDECPVMPPNRYARRYGDLRVAWIIPIFQILIEQINVIGGWPRSGSAPPPAIHAGAGLPLAR